MMKKRYSRAWVIKGVDEKYRIVAPSPFGRKLIEQVRGTKAHLTRESAEKKLKRLM
jgi:hypothetical protein